jgi:murein DD-endopeptidase MepM/ murein hydrolase activator NlpD
MNALKTLVLAAVSLTSMSMSAQDLIARQAPADTKLKDVQLIQFTTFSTSKADLENPAANIYSNWTRTISDAQGVVPANYHVDLRGFHMPTPSRQVNSPYGRRWGRLHAGLDIKVYLGDTIRAAFDGKVRIVDYNARGYGYYVVIRHPNGLETLYGHLSRQLVREDQIVRAGEVIGLGGNTGRSFGSHLHFETRLLGQPINPALMFDFPNQDVKQDYYVVRHAMHKGDTNVLANQQNQENMVSAPATPGYSVFSSQQTTPAAKEEPKTHTVQRGETIYSISKRYGLTVDELRRINGLRRYSVLRPGQVLKCS